jgi:hypothetical protein
MVLILGTAKVSNPNRTNQEVVRVEDELLVTAEVALRVRKPVGTLRQWRHRGVGPRGFKVGNTVVYRASEVSRWLAEQEALEARTRAAA